MAVYDGKLVKPEGKGNMGEKYKCHILWSSTERQSHNAVYK